MNETTITPSTQKVRRDVCGGKRADGHLRERRVRRPDARRIERGFVDRSLTRVAGLAAFGSFLREERIDRDLRQFDRLKDDPRVVYPMGGQLRLLLDASTAGEPRVFGLESLAADPLFVHLAGGVVPSLDTVYRDLCRFDARAITDLESMMAREGLRAARGRRLSEVHLDVDTTVEPLFGSQEGALPGYNPRYHGRPSYHPLLVRLAETNTVVGAVLRHGDRGFGATDVPSVEKWIDRVREALGPRTRIWVRMDAAGDCTEFLSGIQARKALFVIKARMTAGVCGAALARKKWRTVETDAHGKPVRQVADLDFAREEWKKAGLHVRVVAVRERDRAHGKELFLWPELDYTVQVYLTNELDEPAEELARRYNLRAGIEPTIGELKNDWGIGKVPSQDFNANHAMLLLKLLGFNLIRRFVEVSAPELAAWKMAWLRRVLICVPGRLVRPAGRRWRLRTPPFSRLSHLLN